MIARLKRRSEFLRVARAQIKWVTPGLILQARKRTASDKEADSAPGETPAIRIGFTVSRKVGGAVERNRA
ncbi:MAG: ribonuclease P protein component, partial [Rhodospirillales bacterium]